MADGGIERPERAVQRVKVCVHLPQNVLIGAFFLPDAAQQLPCLVQLSGIGNYAGVQNLFQRFQQRRYLRHKGKGRFPLVAAGLLFQPAGAAQPQQKAHGQRVRVAGGLLVLIARTVGIQRKGLCQCGKVILGTPDGLRTGNAVIRRVAALLPEQKQQFRIKSPVRPRQRAEQPRGHQFKQLHGNVLSCSHQNTFLLYHKTTRFDRETIQNCRRCISETTAVVSEMLFHGKGSYRETASLPKGAKKRRGGLLPSNPAGLPPPSVREATLSVTPYGVTERVQAAKKPRGAGCSSGQVNSSILRIKLYDTDWTISIAIAA